MSTHIPSNILRQLFFIGIILMLGVVLVKETYFMISAFLGAFTLYVLMRNFMFLLQYRYKWKPWLASLFLMVISLLLIVMPFVWVFSVVGDKIQPLFSDHQIVLDAFKQIDKYISDQFQISLFTESNIKQAIAKVSTFAPALIGTTLSAISNLFLMYFILHFILINGKSIEKYVRTNLPVNDRNTHTVLKEIKDMVFSNAIGIPVLGVVQGLVACIGYWIFGVKGFLLWGIMTGICSVVPVLGTMIVWVPIALYAFAVGDAGNGIGLSLWGLLVIGLSDNIFRFILQKKLADVHPLITLFGVIVGVNIFGFMGLVFGPLLISFFILILKVYKDEFHSHNKEMIV